MKKLLLALAGTTMRMMMTLALVALGCGEVETAALAPDGGHSGTGVGGSTGSGGGGAGRGASGGIESGMAGASGGPGAPAGGVSGGAGMGGASLVARLSYTFDTDKQGWTLSSYPDTNYFNWGATINPDSGVALDGGVAPVIDLAAGDGDPAPGALRVTVAFTGFKQYIDAQVNLAIPQDLSGAHGVLKARVRIVSGSLPAGGVRFHVSSGAAAFVYAAAPLVDANRFDSGAWTTIVLDTSSVTSSDSRVFDPTQIVQIGLQFTTGEQPANGTLPFGRVVFEIDTVQA